jgi:hypothetical protein
MRDLILRNVRKENTVQVNPSLKLAMIFGSVPSADLILDGLVDPGRRWTA